MCRHEGGSDSITAWSFRCLLAEVAFKINNYNCVIRALNNLNDVYFCWNQWSSFHYNQLPQLLKLELRSFQGIRTWDQYTHPEKDTGPKNARLQEQKAKMGKLGLGLWLGFFLFCVGVSCLFELVFRIHLINVIITVMVAKQQG